MSGCAESGWFFFYCGIMFEQVAFIYLICDGLVWKTDIGNLKKKHKMSVSRHSLGLKLECSFGAVT